MPPAYHQLEQLAHQAAKSGRQCAEWMPAVGSPSGIHDYRMRVLLVA
ncbi:hypothetical protein MuYL_2015 [Mucilaginibacter xinganensis]|uniref:Uncharacterized protein n=1 Tax=Mucilaginibacter xinganensis TaxID=1234841 RepID=A0A223NVM0_9SPHI|nr:hypothetical protein MuYL_2015 [Mucilaginibacter xinganensis]